MEDLVIKKSDLEKFGKNLMKKIDEYLHDEYTLTFPEMKLEQEKFDKYLNKIPESIYRNIELEKITLKEKYKNENLSIGEMYDILDRVNLEFELDEDLYCLKEAYLYLYLVFDQYYTYLLKH